MGGGEVARYIGKYSEERLHSVVFAAAVPPYLQQTENNPEGPLTEELAEQMESGLEHDRDAFFDQFTTQFFSAGEELKVTEAQRQDAIAVPPVRPEGRAGLHGGVRDDRTSARTSRR